MSNSGSIYRRMVRAATLDADLYEEVEADRGATRQALLVVLVYSVCAGIGSGLASIPAITAVQFFVSLLLGMVSALVFWAIWSFITFLIGTKVFKGPQTSATYTELLRTVGFSASPGVLLILVFIPFIGWLFSFGALIWMLVAMVVAVRQALDFSTWRALGTCAVGAVLYLLLMSAVSTLLRFVILGTTI